MISYFFPPRGGSGVQRAFKFAKYLPEFGWEPIILTVSNLEKKELDLSLLEGSAGDMRISRAWSCEPHRFFAGLSKGGAAKNPAHIFGKVKNFLGSCLFIPDRHIGWFPAAFLRGMRIIKENKIDVIYSTSDPFTGHLVAYFLKKVSGLPWIAEFRDPWTQNAFYRYPFRCRQKIDESLERRFLAAADKVVVTCRALIDSWMQKYPTLDKTKFIEITNGFDPNDFEGLSRNKPDQDKFSIVFAGRFSSEINSSPSFFRALANLIEEKRKRIKFILVGHAGNEVHDLIRKLSLEGVVELAGYVSHRRSVEYLLGADLLLLTRNHGDGLNLTYPGKIFEYLAARKPILALVTEGATADMIRRMRVGVVVPPDDIQAITEAISSFYGKHENGASMLDARPNLDQFERRNLTRSLAHCLNSAAAVGSEGVEKHG